MGRKHRSGVGYSHLYSVIDDHARLVYSEILADERKDTATAFWQRAKVFFVRRGITVQRVIIYNGSW